MKFRACILFCSLLTLFANAVDFNNLPANTYLGELSSSWGSENTGGHEDYIGNSAVCMNPSNMIHLRIRAHGGAGAGDFFQSGVPTFMVAHFGYQSNGYNHILMSYTTDPGTSNTVYGLMTNLFGTPAILYNGTVAAASTGVMSTSVWTHYSMGITPGESSDGSPGTRQTAQAGSTNAAAFFGFPYNDWFGELISSWTTDYAGPKYAWSSLADHQSKPGQKSQSTGFELSAGFATNVWTLNLHWDGSSVSAFQCAASSISKTGNTLAFTFRVNRMMGGWDVPNAATGITNDARHFVDINPAYGNAFYEVIRIPDCPDGAFNLQIDSYLIQTTGAQLRAGYNTYTNYTNPWWDQKVAVLGIQRDRRGENRITLLEHAGNADGVDGLMDEVKFMGQAFSLWGSGSRGDALIAGMNNWEADLWTFDARANTAAQQTNHTVSVTVLPLWGGKR